MKCIVLKPTSSNFTILFSFPMPKSISSNTFYAISFQFCNIRSCCPFGNCKPFGNFLVLDRWVIYYKSKSVKNFLSAIFRQSFGKCNETPIAFYRVIVFCIIFSAIFSAIRIIIRPFECHSHEITVCCPCGSLDITVGTDIRDTLYSRTPSFNV